MAGLHLVSILKTHNSLTPNVLFPHFQNLERRSKKIISSKPRAFLPPVAGAFWVLRSVAVRVNGVSQLG